MFSLKSNLLLLSSLSRSGTTLRSPLFHTCSVIRKDGSVFPEPITDVIKTSQEIEHDKALQGYITVDCPLDVTAGNGVPEEHIVNRKVLIKCPTKNAMQSGTNNIHGWQISFETRERWENRLMGWSSSADPLSNMHVSFATQEEAIEFCDKNRWKWELQQPPQKTPAAKSYAANFSWNKRTRRSTK